MRKLINYINSEVLVKITSIQAASVLTRIVAGILTSKAIAVFIGSEGLALIGNFRNFVSSIQSLSILGFYNGMVKYVSEVKEDLKQLGELLSTVFYVGFVSTVLVSITCYLLADYLNDLIFPTYYNYAFAIRIFAVVLPFYALNMYSFSIMNGFSKYKILIVINIIGQVLGLSVALLLIYQNRIDGALISIAIAESLIFLITLVGITNRRSLVHVVKIESVSLGFAKKLSQYSLIALFSAILLPLVFIFIRSYIIEEISYKDAGFWEAMTRISKYYLLFVTALMSYYVVPRFRELETTKEFKKEVINFYKSVIPVFSLVLIAIYFLRSQIISIVFTEEFAPVEELFIWQLLGDFVKVLSMVIAYQFLVKKMFWHYIVTEAFLVIMIYTTSIYFIDIFGLKGVVMAHLLSHVMYYGVILLIVGTSLFGLDNDKIGD